MSGVSSRIVRSRRNVKAGTIAAQPSVFPSVPLSSPAIPSAPVGSVPEVSLSDEQIRLRQQVLGLLDTISLSAEGEDVPRVVRELMGSLQRLRSSVTLEDWNDIAVPAARAHALAEIVRECPFTHRSYQRPRGYPGDAELLDLVYRHEDKRHVIDGLSEVGRAVFDITTGVAASEAVRQRRQVVARKIDALAEHNPAAEILAVACGHLRELDFSDALLAGRFGRFVATDQDADSLRVVEGVAQARALDITARRLSVKDFVAEKHGLGSFDLVYATGLYDYLDDRVASRLTRKLFALLKPGGRLLIPNLLVGIPEEAYMEIFMDWYMIYRDEARIRAFASEISELDLRTVTYFEDAAGHIGYLELERA